MKKLTYIAIILALLSPSISMAATKAKAKVVAKPVIQCVESTAQVADLQAQIASLQAQLAQKNTVQTNNLSVNLISATPDTGISSKVVLTFTNSGKTPVVINKFRYQEQGGQFANRVLATTSQTTTREAVNTAHIITSIDNTTKEADAANPITIAPDTTVNVYFYGARNMVLTDVITSGNTSVVGLPITIKF